MTATVISPDSIFDTNPYETHPSLSPLEADVLWEYAKLSHHVKEVCIDILIGRTIEQGGRVDDSPNA